MQRTEEITVQTAKPSAIQRVEKPIVGLELNLRKLVLSAGTMLGIGYVMVNIPFLILMGYYLSLISISSQANVTAISSRLLFLIASALSSSLGIVIVIGGVKFYEGKPTSGTAFLGAVLASFYLLCLGIGSALLLPSGSLTSFLFLLAPMLTMFGASAFIVPNSGFKLAGAIAGMVGGALFAYVMFNVPVFDLVFNWGIPFTGPFMSFQVLEGVVAITGSGAALIHSVAGAKREEKPLAHASILVVALVYGISVFVGSLILSMSLWNMIWKSPWVGPLSGLHSWILNTIVFWSASLFLTNIGGILLIITSCLGFVFVAKEISNL